MSYKKVEIPSPALYDDERLGKTVSVQSFTRTRTYSVYIERERLTRFMYYMQQSTTSPQYQPTY